MKICARCLYPANHPLNITFDESGVCSGCRIHEEKDSLDWQERWQKLVHLVNSYRRKGNNYDCVVPVSGARDSFFIVHTVKYKLGLNPLLVSYNRHYNTKSGIANLATLRTLLDCDLLTLTVNPEVVKKIVRATLQARASLHWHVLAGQSVYPVSIAVGYKIPLIIWGAHQGCDQVGMFSHTDEVEMTRKYRKEHDLMGIEAEDLMSEELSEQQLLPYCYPHDKQIESLGIRGIYLSNYLRWDSKAQHEQMLKMYNYKVGDLQRTFDTYNDVDCLHYAGLHDYIKFLKYGFGKVSDHACREIRLRRLSRKAALTLVERYQQIIPEDTKLFCSWLNISEAELWKIVDQHRDPKAWIKRPDGSWQLKINHKMLEAAENPNVALSPIDLCSFTTNSEIALLNQLLTKGYSNVKAPACDSDDF